MDISPDTLKEQLMQLHQREEMFFRHRTTIKNWAITIWFALLAIIIAKPLPLNTIVILAILTAPVFLFWFFQAVYTAIANLNIQQGMEIEQRIADKNLSIDKISDVFIFSRYRRFSISEKIIAFLRGAFTQETTLIFYIALLISSVLFVFLLYPHLVA